MSDKDYSRVDIAVHINSSLETGTLYEIYKKRNWSYGQDRGGPLLTIGSWSGKPVCIAPLIHVIEGVRVMYVEATSGLVDWDMIEAWIKGVTGKDDIRIVSEPANLIGEISSVLYRRAEDLKATAA